MAPRWIALGIVTLARVSLGVQFQSLASVALPLSREFGMGYADLGFLIGLYMLPGIVLAAPGGVLGQRFGDKRMVCIGLALMIAGGALSGFAASYAVFVTGRLIAGIGGVLLNVLMSKMVTDWFAGREVILAMAIFIDAFPIGVGLALLLLGPLADALGWRVALSATAVVAMLALLLVIVRYRRHDNDRRVAMTSPTRGRISRREIALVLLAGAIWGCFNGGYAIVVSFTSILLVHRDLTVGTASVLVGASTWIGVLSIPAGGMIAQRWGHPNALLVASSVVCGACLLVVPSIDPALPLLATGLLLGVPVGIITALPAEVLRPGSRGAGLGLFFTCLYVGFAGLPPIAGWLQDLSGSPATSLYCAGALFLALVPLFVAFRLVQRQLPYTQAATP
jgi:predicted MFS family arabinose efflux permease